MKKLSKNRNDKKAKITAEHCDSLKKTILKRYKMKIKMAGSIFLQWETDFQDNKNMSSTRGFRGEALYKTKMFKAIQVSQKSIKNDFYKEALSKTTILSRSTQVGIKLI